MKKLQIAVGIIRNPQGEIFITQRAADAHMANKLEFPGGKIESDETPEPGANPRTAGGGWDYGHHLFAL